MSSRILFDVRKISAETGSSSRLRSGRPPGYDRRAENHGVEQINASGANTRARTGTSASRPPEPTYQLALISSRGYESNGGGFHIVEGQVKNISDQPLKNVTAVATWLDKDGGFIKSDNAIIEYNPILPGQISPFKTMSSTNPAMEKYSVGFKTLFGGSLAVDDQRR